MLCYTLGEGGHRGLAAASAQVGFQPKAHHRPTLQPLPLRLSVRASSSGSSSCCLPAAGLVVLPVLLGALGAAVPGAGCVGCVSKGMRRLLNPAAVGSARAITGRSNERHASHAPGNLAACAALQLHVRLAGAGARRAGRVVAARQAQQAQGQRVQLLGQGGQQPQVSIWCGSQPATSARDLQPAHGRAGAAVYLVATLQQRRSRRLQVLAQQGLLPQLPGSCREGRHCRLHTPHLVHGADGKQARASGKCHRCICFGAHACHRPHHELLLLRAGGKPGLLPWRRRCRHRGQQASHGTRTCPLARAETAVQQWCRYMPRCEARMARRQSLPMHLGCLDFF